MILLAWKDSPLPSKVESASPKMDSGKTIHKIRPKDDWSTFQHEIISPPAMTLPTVPMSPCHCTVYQITKPSSCTGPLNPSQPVLLPNPLRAPIVFLSMRSKE